MTHLVMRRGREIYFMCVYIRDGPWYLVFDPTWYTAPLPPEHWGGPRDNIITVHLQPPLVLVLVTVKSCECVHLWVCLCVWVRLCVCVCVRLWVCVHSCECVRLCECVRACCTCRTWKAWHLWSTWHVNVVNYEQLCVKCSHHRLQ